MSCGENLLPMFFLRAAELLTVRPEACCVIEDSVAGVQAAVAAGMPVLAIPNTLPTEMLSAATKVVRSYPEIARLLCRD